MSTATEPDPDAAISARGKIVSTVAVIASVIVVLALSALHKTAPLGSADMTITPPFNIPAPPHSTPYESTNNIIATVFMVLVGLTGVALGVRERIKTGSLLPLMIALSGAMITFPEVFFDVMGGVYFPFSADNHAYTILGRTMPWWIVAGWFGYGAFNYFIFKLLMANPRTKTLWMMLGAAAIGDVVFEEILLSLGVYHYYGNQPLIVIAALPWWWIPCNSIGVFLAAALAYRYRESLRGWRSLSMFFITPLSVGAVYGFIALPSWVAVNGHYSWLPTQLLGLLTIVLGIAVFMFILEAVLGRPPLKLNYRPPVSAEASAAQVDTSASGHSAPPKVPAAR
jgi:hypothetical protein